MSLLHWHPRHRLQTQHCEAAISVMKWKRGTPGSGYISIFHFFSLSYIYYIFSASETSIWKEAWRWRERNSLRRKPGRKLVSGLGWRRKRRMRKRGVVVADTDPEWNREKWGGIWRGLVRQDHRAIFLVTEFCRNVMDVMSWIEWYNTKLEAHFGSNF